MKKQICKTITLHICYSFVLQIFFSKSVKVIQLLLCMFGNRCVDSTRFDLIGYTFGKKKGKYWVEGNYA